MRSGAVQSTTLPASLPSRYLARWGGGVGFRETSGNPGHFWELLTLVAHHVPPSGPAFPSRAMCARDRAPSGTLSVCLTVCTFISPLPHPFPSTLSTRMPLSLCLPTHTPPPALGHGPPPHPPPVPPSRPPPLPWHRMARCLTHHGPRITPARWALKSSKPASSAWVMILATTPRYLPPAWSTLKGGLWGEK